MANQYADALYKAINTIANDATQDLAAKLPEYFVGKVIAAASGDTTGYVVQILGSSREYECSASSVYKINDIVMVQTNGSTHTIIGYAEQPLELQKFFNFYYDSNACYSNGSKNNILTAQIRGGGDLVWFSVNANSGELAPEEIETHSFSVQVKKDAVTIANKTITINDIEGNPYDINDTLRYKIELPNKFLSVNGSYSIEVSGTGEYFSNVTAYVGKSDGKRFTYETGFRLAATQVSGGPYSTDYTSLTLDYTQPTGAYYLKATFELNGVDVTTSGVLSNLAYSIDGKTVAVSPLTNDITLDINSYRGKDTAYVKTTADWVLNATETLHLQDQLPIIIKSYPELQITKNAAGTGLNANLLIAGAAVAHPTYDPWSEMPSSEVPALPRVQYNWKDINSDTVVVNGGSEFVPTGSQESDLTKWACSAFVNEDDSTLASPNNHYIGTAYLAAGENGEMGPTGPQGEQGPQGEVGPTGPSGISATMYTIEAPWEVDKDAGGKFADTVVDTVFKVKRSTGGENPEYMTGGSIVFSFLPSGDSQTISFNGADSIQPIWEDTISTPHVWMLGPTSGGNATPLTDVEQIICEYYSADDSLHEHKLDTHKINVTQEFFLPDFIKNWNGKTIFGDNFIASPQGGFGATGPNGFTGVLLGAFQPTGASGESSYNGIAGFKENERTFKLDAESGLASFGTKAKGELVFDPANGLIIESGNYVYDPGTPTGHGMSIKFQDGGPSGYEGPYIRWGNGNFVVDALGNVWINGKLTFSAASSPVKIVYNESGNSTTDLKDHWDDIPLSPSGTYAGWHKTENSNTDRYAAYTYDGGHSWTDAIKVRGEDGTSVSVKPNADACTQIGDGYIDNNSSSVYYGHLMILTGYDGQTKVFADAGEIKGPQGATGDTGPTGPQGEQGPQGSTGTSATNYYITSNTAALHRNALGEFEEASITFSAWEKTGSGNPTGSSQYWGYKIDDDNWTSISTKASTKSISKSSYSSATKKLIVGIFSNSSRTILLAQIVIPVEAVLSEFIKEWDGKSAQLEGNHVIAMQAAFGDRPTGSPSGFTGVVLGSFTNNDTDKFSGIIGLFTPSGTDKVAQETFRLDAQDGSIIARKGEIAGWTIKSDRLIAGTDSTFVGISPSGDYAFWAGSPTGAKAPFRVTHNGQLTAQNISSLKFLDIPIAGKDNGISNFQIGKYKIKIEITQKSFINSYSNVMTSCTIKLNSFKDPSGEEITSYDPSNPSHPIICIFGGSIDSADTIYTIFLTKQNDILTLQGNVNVPLTITNISGGLCTSQFSPLSYADLYNHLIDTFDTVSCYTNDQSHDRLYDPNTIYSLYCQNFLEIDGSFIPQQTEKWNLGSKTNVWALGVFSNIIVQGYKWYVGKVQLENSSTTSYGNTGEIDLSGEFIKIIGGIGTVGIGPDSGYYEYVSIKINENAPKITFYFNGSASANKKFIYYLVWGTD